MLYTKIQGDGTMVNNGSYTMKNLLTKVQLGMTHSILSLEIHYQFHAITLNSLSLEKMERKHKHLFRRLGAGLLMIAKLFYDEVQI